MLTHLAVSWALVASVAWMSVIFQAVAMPLRPWTVRKMEEQPRELVTSQKSMMMWRKVTQRMKKMKI